MSQSDPFYANFTIYPIHDQRVNETATKLYQMVKIQDEPLYRSVNNLDLMCFPDLFPYGDCGQRFDRSIRLRDCDFIKAKLMSVHPQYRRNIQYLFYLLNDCNMRQLNAGIYQLLNVVNVRHKYTAKSCLERLNNGELESDLQNMYYRLRNTAQYWKKPMCELMAMIFHYDPPHWFITLSPSEWMMPDLAQYLREVNSDVDTTRMSISELCAFDPVSTV